ncbi:hypothetical protein [Corynebacterium sp. sy039]|uniref:hypothetical protein n=1 Tax=Corynebacterium sp. sy039 TaxID=2599641 RepID=UPI0011B7CCA4|nr:hypothetical protein [Corynebacterium sp. sy039]QDZ43007.1 hypothetical protein FQV43_07405 [Corynebacterium sp. sy039]
MKKIGDKAEVTWQVQVAPLVQSEEHIQTSKSAQIMVPATVDVNSIRLTHMPTRPEYGDESKGEDPNKTYGKDIQGNTVGGALEDDGEVIAELKSAPAQEVDYEVPIKDSSELDLSNVERDATYGITPFYKFTAEESEKLGQPWGVELSSFADQPEWNFYQINLGNDAGVYTFEVTGTVEAVGEDTYVPIRVDNLIWKCSSEDQFGSAEEGCAPLKSNYDWAQSGELPPVMTKEQSEYTHEEIVNVYKNRGTEHGLYYADTCVPTLNTDRFDTISVDLYPDRSARYQKYVNTFNLRLNPGLDYYGSLLGREDNCDQGFQHITLCPDEETEVPPSEEPVESEEPTPSDEPQESEESTPSEEEVEPAKPSKETEEPTSSEEPQESEENKPVKPGERPEEREEPKVSVVSSTPPDADTDSEVVTTIVEPEGKPAQPEQDKPADSKPESNPESKTVISESVKDNVAKQAKTVAKKDRPKVTTGGHLRAA